MTWIRTISASRSNVSLAQRCPLEPELRFGLKDDPTAPDRHRQRQSAKPPAVEDPIGAPGSLTPSQRPPVERCSTGHWATVKWCW